jgi:hypothetical protein
MNACRVEGFANARPYRHVDRAADKRCHHGGLTAACSPERTPPNCRRTRALAQDYDKYPNIYVPDVQRSRVLARNGEDFQVYLRLYRPSGLYVNVC